MPTRQKPLTPALLKKTLKTNLRSADRIAILGIGSDLRGDDAAGVLVARKLAHALATSRSRAAAFDGGTAPENLTGEIIRFIRSGGADSTGHIVLVDAADMKLKPGALCLLVPRQILGMSFSTHQLPLSVLTDYLQQSLGCAITIIAIQPDRTGFGDPICPAITAAVTHVVAALRGAIKTRPDARK
jgi:hydrogenase maturation protease HycI